jgi:hypothetical protein
MSRRAKLALGNSKAVWTPTPDPSPQGGGERVSVAAMLRSNMISANLKVLISANLKLSA